MATFVLFRLTLFLLGAGTGAAFAEPCAWRPSEAIGGGGVGTMATGGAAAAGAGTAMQAAGFYAFTHAAGATMLASTAGGASAAGTVGIMGGTAGAVGTAGAILMAPVTIIAGAVVAVGTGGWEGVCYLKDDRISDYDQVLSVLRKAADQVRSINFMVVNPDSPEHQARLVVGNSSGEFESYDVEDIYIVNEEVYHRDWFLNTNLGPVPFD